MNLQRRRFLRLTGAGVPAALAGCLGGDGDGTGGDGGDWVHDQEQMEDPEFITMWTFGAIDEQPGHRAHINRFTEETGIDVEVEPIPPGDVLEQARASIQGESSAVDVWAGDFPFVLDLGADGALEDVSEYISEENFEGWVDGAKKSAQMPIPENADFEDFPYRDGIYATPFFASGWTCWTNKDVLEEAGLDRNANPETFTEFREMAEQIADVDGIDYPVQYPFSGFISGLPIIYDLTLRADGHFFDGGDPDFENEGFIEAADFLLGLVNDGLAPQGVTSITESQALTNFFNNDIGMMFEVTSAIFTDPADLPIDGDPFDVAQINLYPTPDSIGYNETPTGNFFEVQHMLPIFSEKKEPAAQYMAQVCSREGQAEQLVIEGDLPCRSDVFETAIVQENMPEGYIEPMSVHLEGLDKLVHQQPARVGDTVLARIQEGIGSGLSGEEVAANIQQDAEGFAI